MTLEEVRAKLIALGQTSHTSRKFQDDILEFIERNVALGSALIEVGCYHGGLTAQLAFVASQYNKVLHVIDIEAGYLAMAEKAVTEIGLRDHVQFHLMDLAQFVSKTSPSLKPLLVFVDGDHRYEGVVADIRAIRSMSPPPFACAFHDYSLRYQDGPLTNVRVDKAIKDECGPEVRTIPIGEVAGKGSTLRVAPSEDRHFHETGQPEGVIILGNSVIAKAS